MPRLLLSAAVIAAVALLGGVRARSDGGEVQPTQNPAYLLTVDPNAANAGQFMSPGSNVNPVTAENAADINGNKNLPDTAVGVAPTPGA